MKKLFIALAIFGVFSGQAIAGTVSFDQLAVSSDLTAAKYNSDLNRVYQKVNSAIQSDNIENDTLLEADFADEINPRVRTAEGASCEFVYTGLLPVTGASLTTSISAGTAYPKGYRIVKSSATPHTYTASRWTWVDLDQNGDFQYSEVSIGGVTPSVAANSVRLAKVSSDATTVNTVTDLRTTSCTSGPLDIIADATGEANLADIFEEGNGGWLNGLNLKSKDSTSVYVQPGASYINGEYRALTSALTVPVNSLGSSTQGTSGLDSGSVAGSTIYYLYGTADLDGVTPLTGIFSTSSTSPTGATNFRRLGEFKTDASGSLVSADATSVSYLGKIRQVKRLQTGAVASGTTAIPDDDTVPQITEGDQYMELSVTPTSAANKLKIDVVVNGSSGGNTLVAALFQGTTANAIAAQRTYTNNSPLDSCISFSHIMTANVTSERTFKVRMGYSGGATTTFNGISGARKLGGVLASSITITEYEP